MDILKEKYLEEMKKVQGIEVRAIPERSYLHPGIKYQMPVLFQVLAGDLPENLTRDPVNLCLVLDRSGSMNGQPLENCKKAISNLISKLNNNDLLHLVVYDDKIDTIFENKRSSDLEELTPIINDIKARGTTNISGGLERAAEILRDSESMGTKIIFLFSDGLANAGNTNLDSLGSNFLLPQVRDHDITFSSFGIGSDYNEKWLQSIARSGNGNYFYIDTVERIPEIVDKGLRGFTTMMAKNLTMRAEGVNNLRLVSFNQSNDYDTMLNGKKINVLREHGLIQFMGTIELGGSHEPGVLRYSLNWDWVLDDFANDENGFSHTLKLTPSSNVDQLRERNPEVVVYQSIIRGGEMSQQVTDAMESGDSNKAIELKEKLISHYESVKNLDKYGMIEVMIKREREALDVLKREGLTRRSFKHQSYYGRHARAAAGLCAREAYEEEDEEEDEDMGFGLFD